MAQSNFWPSAIRKRIPGNHGRKAAMAGQSFEQLVTNCAQTFGCRVQSNAKTSWASLYGPKIRVDHLIFGLPGFPDGLAIETRYQNSPGSIHQKMYYLCENILRCYQLPTIIVYDGGAREVQEAAAYHKRHHVDGIKLLAILSLMEWFAWIEQQMAG